MMLNQLINVKCLCRYILFFLLSLLIITFLHYQNKIIDPLNNFQYNWTYQIQEEEINFPIAFSLIIYQDFDRFLRLLKVIYREHNTYCIHVDRKSSRFYYWNVKSAAKIIGPHNIYVVSEAERVAVRWGQFTVLEADLICARILYEKNKKWKYFINLTGHEFPLRTNWELVRALRLLNGSNIAMGEFEQRMKKRIPPQSYLKFNVTWAEGSVHIAVRREYVQYMLFNPKSIELLNALKTHQSNSNFVIVSDEQYFQTLNNNPKIFPIPGSYLGGIKIPTSYPLMTRAKIWITDESQCKSRTFRNSICLFGIDDYIYLVNHTHFFANKFIPSVEPEGYDKLEQWLYEKMNYELVHKKLHPTFNEKYYTAYDLSWNHL